jgi:mRNA interferase MazF
VVKKSKLWSPERQDIIWIDCSPQSGQEMRNIHPFLVLSPGGFNVKTALVIGLPMTTAVYNADNPFAIDLGDVSKGKVNKRGYVLCHQPKSFDWRVRGAKAHPLGKLDNALFVEVCDRLNQIIQLK